MKDIVRKIVLKALGLLARKRLRKLSPRIIGISGSVGKTSTKEAVAHVLRKKYRVLKSDSSYNTDFGIYLTILEEKSGLSSFSSWLKVLIRAFFKTFSRVEKVDYLILEMGTDQLGDMGILLHIVVPDFALMTRISENHFSEGQFPSLEAMFEEDVQLQAAVSQKEGGVIFMNSDDSYQGAYIKNYKGKGKLVEYSVSKDTKNIQEGKEGLSFDMDFQGEMHHFVAPILGAWHVEVLLPTIFLAKSIGMTNLEIQEALQDYHLPQGRLNVIPGKEDTTIIDSSYNASPLAVENTVKLLGTFQEGRRVFVFGNMNELGEKSDFYHEHIGEIIPGNVDLLITVGPGPKIAASKALSLGFLKESYVPFEDAVSAANFYETVRKPGDILLVKGSQNRVRLERFIKKIMLHPEDAPHLLVRQSAEWNIKQ